MKKQELIHLHGLLAEVGNHFEESQNQSIDIDDYETMGVRPTSIHRSKTDHKAAVFELVDGITTRMQTEAEAETETETVAASAD